MTFPPKFKATKDLERDNEKLRSKVWRLREDKARLKRKVKKLKKRIAAGSIDAVASGEVDERPLRGDPAMEREP